MQILDTKDSDFCCQTCANDVEVLQNKKSEQKFSTDNQNSFGTHREPVSEALRNSVEVRKGCMAQRPPPLHDSTTVDPNHHSATLSLSSSLLMASPGHQCTLSDPSAAPSLPILLASPSHFKVAIRIRPPLSRELERLPPVSTCLSVRDEGLTSTARATVTNPVGASLSSSVDLPFSISCQNIFELSTVDPTAITMYHVEDAVAEGDHHTLVYPRRKFYFDYVFDGKTGQATFYERCARDVVRSVLQGINGTLMAYGQTGTGKTYTMEGFTSEEERGIIPRAVEEVFRFIEVTKKNEDVAADEEASGAATWTASEPCSYEHAHGETEKSSSSPEKESTKDVRKQEKTFAVGKTTTVFQVVASFFQIHNEVVSDLLSNGADVLPDTAAVEHESSRKCGALSPSSRALRICHTPRDGVIVEGLSEWKVNCEEDVYALIERGTSRRATSTTQLSDFSSRSHAIFALKIHSTSTTVTALPSTTASTATLGGGAMQDSTRSPCGFSTTYRVGKLSIVDLAGSEKVRHSGVSGPRLVETKYIHKSLHALANVMAALIDQQQQPSRATRSLPLKHQGQSGTTSSLTHIPFRNSALTSVLRDSLGGNCVTVLIACLSPSMHSHTESFFTLSFAHRARLLRNHAVPNLHRIQKKSPLQCPLTSTTSQNVLLAERKSNAIPSRVSHWEVEQDSVQSIMMELQQRCHEMQVENEALVAALNEKTKGIEAFKNAHDAGLDQSHTEKGRKEWWDEREDEGIPCWSGAITETVHADETEDKNVPKEKKTMRHARMEDECKRHDALRSPVRIQKGGSRPAFLSRRRKTWHERNERTPDEMCNDKKESNGEEALTGTECEPREKMEHKLRSELKQCYQLIEDQRDVILSFTVRLEEREQMMMALLEELKRKKKELSPCLRHKNHHERHEAPISKGEGKSRTNIQNWNAARRKTWRCKRSEWNTIKRTQKSGSPKFLPPFSCSSSCRRGNTSTFHDIPIRSLVANRNVRFAEPLRSTTSLSLAKHLRLLRVRNPHRPHHCRYLFQAFSKRRQKMFPNASAIEDGSLHKTAEKQARTRKAEPKRQPVDSSSFLKEEENRLSRPVDAGQHRQKEASLPVRYPCASSSTPTSSPRHTRGPTSTSPTTHSALKIGSVEWWRERWHSREHTPHQRHAMENVFPSRSLPEVPFTEVSEGPTAAVREVDGGRPPLSVVFEKGKHTLLSDDVDKKDARQRVEALPKEWSSPHWEDDVGQQACLSLLPSLPWRKQKDAHMGFYPEEIACCSAYLECERAKPFGIREPTKKDERGEGLHPTPVQSERCRFLRHFADSSSALSPRTMRSPFFFLPQRGEKMDSNSINGEGMGEPITISALPQKIKSGETKEMSDISSLAFESYEERGWKAVAIILEKKVLRRIEILLKQVLVHTPLFSAVSPPSAPLSSTSPFFSVTTFFKKVERELLRLKSVIERTLMALAEQSKGSSIEGRASTRETS